MNATDLAAVLGGMSLLVGGVFTGLIGYKNAQNNWHRRDAERLEQYETWRPKMRRLVADLRSLLSDHRIPEPPGIDETLRFPPAENDEKVSTDD